MFYSWSLSNCKKSKNFSIFCGDNGHVEMWSNEININGG